MGNAMDDQTSTPSAASAEEHEDAEFDAAIKAVVSSGLIAGPDPSIVDEIAQEDGPDPTQEMADDLSADMEVDRIYRSILTRAPEHKVQPSLDRVRDCLDLMGNPQDSFRAIHITGTNGKTSSARMIEALLRERGLRTGRFTSPHLTTVRERICIDGIAISRDAFVQAWEDVSPFIEMVDAASVASGGPRMSFFEVFTVMAYTAFAAAPIDVAVVEVGMGGLWDATNVIDADVAVLAPVAMDHERWLGSAIEDIAHEKLGIVKAGSVFVCAEQTETVGQMAIDRAAEVGAQLVMAGPSMHVISRETAVGGQLISVQTPAARYEDIPLALRGDYQADNAVLAITAVESFFGGQALDGLVVEHALMSVSSPGRLEVVRSSPTVVVDAAHNPHGAAATARALDEYYPGRRVGVIAMMADKDVESYLGEMEPVLEEVVVTGMPSDRAMPSEELEEIARRVFGPDRVHRVDDLLSAIDEAAGIAESDDSEPMVSPAVIVTGSIQLVAEARTLMGKPAPDGA
ncbi:bifunctional folylpolyglutamate synthase/dihydrofolate synthase [Ancrocorticia populi]|uniref:tetrahydrofolate synthase n=1 Tax=Ancrocorticia populi TaxID=2175228 RepID=A0A2V1K652_9ACTO|nr:folylpolyglutamate synthase/dihydrofolate synthase family protein [Ancrocorticia populi]PWF25713.1 dihydrofolate synthase [Ancrocorticia populi]